MYCLEIDSTKTFEPSESFKMDDATKTFEPSESVIDFTKTVEPSESFGVGLTNLIEPSVSRHERSMSNNMPQSVESVIRIEAILRLRCHASIRQVDDTMFSLRRCEVLWRDANVQAVSVKAEPRPKVAPLREGRELERLGGVARMHKHEGDA